MSPPLPPPEVPNQETLIDEPSNGQKDSSSPSQTHSSSPDFIQKGSAPMLMNGKDEEDDIEDDESEFKMGRLIRQASLNSSHKSTPQQTTKLMRGSSCIPRYYLTEKAGTNQEKVMNLRKVESMNKMSRNKSSMKIGKKINDGGPTIPGGLVDKGSSEDMKAQIKFWARTVAFNLHQEC